MHEAATRAYKQLSKGLAGRVCRRTRKWVNVASWPEAADTGCPLYVRFREAERTRFARSEFFGV